MVGCPVVATNVGGVSSLIEDGKSGFFVPANDPYMMAWHLLELHQNKEENEFIGGNAQNVAHERHNKGRIVSSLMEIYNKVIAD